MSGVTSLSCTAWTLSIAGRSISTLIKNQGIGDLYELYAFSKKNNMDYNLVYIPGNFPDTSTQAFDPDYMGKLFDLGFRLETNGNPWKKVPRAGCIDCASGPRLPAPSYSPPGAKP